jgi:hypothetical protein
LEFTMIQVVVMDDKKYIFRYKDFYPDDEDSGLIEMDAFTIYVRQNLREPAVAEIQIRKFPPEDK